MPGPLALVWDLIAKDNASATFRRVGAEAEASAKKTGGFHNAMIGLGKATVVGLAAVGVASLKMGADFQQATTLLVTGAGESEKNIELIRKGLLNMAPAVGIGPTALAKAMFLVESAGFHGAAGLLVMKAAAEGAKIGGAEATVVADGLTTAMKDYSIPATQAARVTSELVATVAAGKTSMGALSASLSNVLPAAAAAHIGLAEVLGAMGTMTAQGISADQTSQNLANTIRSLTNPSAVASHAMAQMGLNSTTVAQQLGKRGLTGTLDEFTTAIMRHMGPAGLVLESAFNQSQLAAQSAREELTKLPPSLQELAKGYLAGTVTQKEWSKELKLQPALTASLGKQFATTAKEAHGFSDTLKGGGGSAKTFNAILSDMTGGATGLNTSLALTGKNMVTFKDNTKGISAATTEAGGHVKGWALTSKDMNIQLDKLKATVAAVAVNIGMHLIPVVEKAVAWFGKHKTATMVLAGVIGGVLVAATVAWTVSLFAAGGALAFLMSPITLVVAAIALLVYGVVKAWNHFKLFRTIVTDAFNGIRAVVITGVRLILDAFMNMVGAILHGAAAAFGWIPGLGGKLKTARDKFDEFHAFLDRKLTAMAGTAAHHPINVNVRTDDARWKVQNFGSWYDNFVSGLNNRAPVVIKAIYTTPGLPVIPGVPARKAKAGGGAVKAGTMYTVNELGLESFVPASDGYILTAGQTKTNQNKAGHPGVTVNQTINPQPYQSEQEIGAIAAARIVWALRR